MKSSWSGNEAGPSAVPLPGDNLAVSVHRRQAGAFESLIARYEAPLFNYAHGILQNAFDAQEVVQDAMMRAHRALTRQYDEARCAALALRPWLFKTVRNLCLNRRRSKTRALERPLESFDDGRLGPFVGPDAAIAQRQEAETVRAALSALPVEARELIVLRFMEEMSYADMARTVGGTEASLRGKVFRSLKLLREALEKGGVAHAV